MEKELTENQKKVLARLDQTHDKWFNIARERIKSLPDNDERKALTKLVAEIENRRTGDE